MPCTEIEIIQRSFLREQGWRQRDDGRWSSPQKPFVWLAFDEAYETVIASYRHWTSFKQRRAALAKVATK